MIVIDGRIVGLVRFLAQAAIRLDSAQIRLDDDDGGAQAAQVRLDDDDGVEPGTNINIST